MKLTGTDNVNKMLDKLNKSMKESMGEIVGYAAELTAEAAKERCGNEYVRNKIEAEMQNESRACVKVRGEAAIYEEFGSENVSPSPYLLPALLQSKVTIDKYMEEKLKG